MRSLCKWTIFVGLAFTLIVISTASQALTPCERRQLWEKEFGYIDTVSPTCRILTTAAVVAASGYVPYPSIAAELGGSTAGTMLNYASAFGVDLKKVFFDKHHICRIIRAGRALHEQRNDSVRRAILRYGLCRPTDAECKSRMQVDIIKRFELADACGQT